MYNRRLLPLIILFVFSSFQSLCQILPLQFYTVRDGLISNQINVLFQDARGYLWVGTNVGISVYDGQIFANYSTADGLPHNYILSIIESRASSGTMWIGTLSGGLSKYRSGKFENILLGADQYANTVTSLLEDRSGNLWCGTAEGLFRVRNSIVERFEQDLEHGGVTGIVEAPDGTLLVGINRSVYVLSPENGQVLDRIALGTRKNAHVRCMIIDDEGDTWISTTDSMLFRLRDRTVAAQLKITYGEAPWYILDDRQGSLWLCVKTCVVKIPKHNFPYAQPVLYTTENGFQATDVGPFLLDREHNIWFGSYNKGLSKLADQNIFLFPMTHLAQSENYAKAVADTSGHLWVASEDGLWEIWRDEDSRWRKYLHRRLERQRSGSPHAIIHMRGRLWILFTEGSIACYQVTSEPQSHSQVRHSQTLVPGSVTPRGRPLCFFIDAQYRLWYSVEGIGVAAIDLHGLPHCIKILGPRDGLPDLSICALYQDRDGNMWFGGYAGGCSVLSHADVSEGTMHKFTTADGLPDNRIRSFLQDAQGRIWIMTEYGGVGFFEQNRFRTVAADKRNSEPTFGFVTAYEGSRLWVSAGLGAPSLTNGISSRFGLIGELRGAPISICDISPGQMVWNLSWNQLTVFLNPKRPIASPPPLISITELLVNGNPHTMVGLIVLEHDESNCAIHFAGLSLKDEKGIRYRYKLDGVDDTWSSPTQQRAVTYAALRPGTYAFHVEAINSEGVSSTKPATLMLTIVPPYWQRWWFVILVAAVLGLTAFVVVRARVRRLLEIERLRVRIASDLHDDVGSSLTRIAVQSQLLKEGVDLGNMRSKLGSISQMSSEAISTMSDIVWSIDARNDTIASLVDRMHDFCASVFSDSSVELRIETRGLNMQKRLAVEMRQSLYLIFKEAIANIAKHSSATTASVLLAEENGEFMMRISDNGKGFQEVRRMTGHGLRNMTMRAERITADIRFVEQDGLTVVLTRKAL